MKNTILLFAFGMLCCSATVVAQNTTPTTTHKVVVQLNSADTAAWGGVIGNIKNLSKIWPDQLQIEVVVHGRALDFLVASKLLGLIKRVYKSVVPSAALMVLISAVPIS